tara:strand:+ start:7488 stop:8861 length:1374 start_codon:yes stop_codon:yes gene_type:complete
MSHSLIKFFSISVILIFVLINCKETTSSSILEANSKCTNGFAKDTYPCENIDLYAQVTPEELGGVRLNDIWGWTDPLTKKEYALVGLTDGVSFVDISDPNNPVIIGKLLEHTSPNKGTPFIGDDFIACTFGIGETEASKKLNQGTTWRDMKTFENYLYVVRDGRSDGNSTHGMQVFDLEELRNYEGIFLEFSETSHYSGLNNAHNIVINEQSGFAYATGVTSSEFCGSYSETGLHIIDINDPLNPTFAGCYFDPDTEISNSYSVGVGYVHDSQCVNYDGPDSEHSGKEICVSSAEGAVVISDVTDKSNISTIGFSGVSQMQYSHQGWLTENQAYFLMNDELDESNLGRNTKTYIWDVKDLDNPIFIGYYTHTTTSIDHNLYIKDNIVYQSNYSSGLRAFRIGNLDNLELTPVAYFDTQPASDGKFYIGTWSSYPFFKSGVIIVSDIEDGLFILRPDF